MYPSDMKGRLARLFRNHQAHLTTFQNTLVECRELFQARARLEAEIELLRSVRNQVQAEVENERRRVESVSNLLLRFSPAHGNRGAAWVEISPLETVLADLLRLALDYDEDEVLRVLGSCAERVTLAGLAAIAGAAEPTAAAIAHKLVREEPPVVAPPWGADLRLVRGRAITVLPPVASHVEEAVREQAVFLHKDAEVVCADTAEAGANIVRLEFHEPRSANDILTQFYDRAFEEAEQNRVLFSMNGCSRHRASNIAPEAKPEAKSESAVTA
jgi:hypothetical protein